MRQPVLRETDRHDNGVRLLGLRLSTLAAVTLLRHHHHDRLLGMKGGRGLLTVAGPLCQLLLGTLLVLAAVLVAWRRIHKSA